MNKIFYKRLNRSGLPIGNLYYVRTNEEAEVFKAVYQPDVKRWLIFFDLKSSGNWSPNCQVFTKRGEPRLFKLEAAFNYIAISSYALSFSALFDPEVSLKYIANFQLKKS